MVSNASDDLPDPDTPVITVNWLWGSDSEISLRLWTRARRCRRYSCKLNFSIAAGGQGGRRLGVDLGSGKFWYEQGQFPVRIFEGVVYWLVLRRKSRWTGLTAIYIRQM